MKTMKELAKEAREQVVEFLLKHPAGSASRIAYLTGSRYVYIEWACREMHEEGKLNRGYNAGRAVSSLA